MVIMVKNETTVPRAENRPNVFGLQGARACYNPTRAPSPAFYKKFFWSFHFVVLRAYTGFFYIYIYMYCFFFLTGKKTKK